MPTTTTSPLNRQTERRYLASDFSKLTNRVTRRFTSPDSTPDSARVHAQEPPANARSNPAAAAPTKFTTPDKRVLSSTHRSTSSSQKGSSLKFAHPGNHKAANVSVVSQGSSRSSSFGHSSGQLDACVKEDDSGTSMHCRSLESDLFTQHVCLPYDKQPPGLEFSLPTSYLTIQR